MWSILITGFPERPPKRDSFQHCFIFPCAFFNSTLSNLSTKKPRSRALNLSKYSRLVNLGKPKLSFVILQALAFHSSLVTEPDR